MKKILLCLFACALATGSLQAQQAADSMRILYRQGDSHVDPAFRDNRTQLEQFLSSLNRTVEQGRLDRIVIRSYSSPDGSARTNDRLTVRRAEALQNYLSEKGNISRERFELHAEGIAWSQLRELVAASGMPGRDEVLEILDRTPEWVYDAKNRVVDSRKKQLMDLQGGRPYKYMFKHLFPELRNSTSTTLYLNVAETGTAAAEPAPAPAPAAPRSEEPRPEAVAACSTSAAPAQARPDAMPEAPATASGSPHPRNIVGVHAGYVTGWIVSYGLTSSTRPGYEVGVTDRILLSERLPFYFRTGLSFIRRGYEINGFDDSRTDMSYLLIPVGVDYTLSLGRRFALIPDAGFYYAVGVGGKRRIGQEETAVFSRDGGFSRHDLGFSCGGDVSYGRFRLGIAYQIGLINIDKSDTVYGDGSNMVGYKHVRNRSFIVRAGINF